METIITIKLPFTKLTGPWKLFGWGGGSIQEFGGSRVNTRRHLSFGRWHILTIARNEYHDRSDEERAKEYLQKWSECEGELRGLRLIMMGDETNAEVKKVIRDSLGVDLDEGTIR